jgi:inhibitor of KinA sporulation pathway (predicted exonuclease)
VIPWGKFKAWSVHPNLTPSVTRLIKEPQFDENGHHSGIDDAKNIAKIAMKMIQDGASFNT